MTLRRARDADTLNPSPARPSTWRYCGCASNIRENESVPHVGYRAETSRLEIADAVDTARRAVDPW